MFGLTPQLYQLEQLIRENRQIKSSSESRQLTSSQEDNLFVNTPIVITGPPGIGKTTFLNNFVHFHNEHRPKSSSPVKFV